MDDKKWRREQSGNGISDNGQLNTIFSFDDSTGSTPMTELLQATDGNLYGSAFSGGTSNKGTLFS